LRKGVAQKLHGGDVTRRKFHGADDEKLPNEEEGEESPERDARRAIRRKGGAKEMIRAAAAGDRRSELRPHHPVANDQQRRQRPDDERLRSLQRGQYQRDGDERAGADHVGDVEGRRLKEAERALELRGGGVVHEVAGLPVDGRAAASYGAAAFSDYRRGFRKLPPRWRKP
jgi:hypothetical protein